MELSHLPMLWITESVGRIGPTFHRTAYPGRAVGGNGPVCRLIPASYCFGRRLIGCNALERKRELLAAIHPRYIILKPSLHGGISGGNEWIAEAEKQHIGWWITSALESNIGLNAIAQWCATFRNPLPQGLGTGLLFTDNVEMPLEIRKDCLWFCK